MQCSDLERYLEAFLDGRLGRARSGLLRRHLVGCAACRTRYESLREFERDLNRRLRAMGPCQSVWAGLELDLVRSAQANLPHVESRPRALVASPPVALPVVAPGGRTRLPQPSRTGGRNVLASRLVGIVLLAAAVGTIIQIGRGLAPGVVDEGGNFLSRLDLLKSPPSEEIRDGDYGSVRSWLATWLGSLPPPLPQAPGFELMGARIEGREGRRVGVVLYRFGDSKAALYLRPQHDSDPARATHSLEASLDSLKGRAWADDGFIYAVDSTLPAEAVQPLRASAGLGKL